ncbi:2-dehydropantoate 2-reductase [Muricauda sp. NFXS6]|uniref:ketopantoate reductase family protein n=1 Tax=Allomuricauda sp. NFXS6 TaxID=2819094 RepID=UPI0032DFDE7D
MNIHIIGAGAIGKALAVSLKRKGCEVQLVRGNMDDGSTRYEEIILALEGERKLSENIKVSTLSAIPKMEGIVLLTNKSFGNQELAKRLWHKTQKTPIILLQNGLGVERPFIESGFDQLYRCVLFATAQTLSGNQVRYRPVSASPIGTVREKTPLLRTLVAEVDSPLFRFSEVENIEPIVWKKTMANCVFNSICPLLEVDNGIFHRNSEVFALAREVIAECIVISQAMGIDLDAKDIEEQVLAISQRSDGQFISTLQDIQNHKETEIETLNLEIHRMAQELGMETQVKNTKLLGELIKSKSKLNQ